MRKIIATSVCIVLAILLYIFTIGISNGYHLSVQDQTPALDLANPSFSQEANEIFISSVADHVDLNSAISMERAIPVYARQINNITFAVFNHTNEPVTFPNQAFGLTILKYNDANKSWENLHLQHVPDSQIKVLPPHLEKWDLEISNSWDILQNDTKAFGYGPIRLYVAGQGKVTNKKYGAYLDLTISK